jgi:hypothetical protein
MRARSDELGGLGQKRDGCRPYAREARNFGLVTLDKRPRPRFLHQNPDSVGERLQIARQLIGFIGANLRDRASKQRLRYCHST